MLPIEKAIKEYKLAETIRQLAESSHEDPTYLPGHGLVYSSRTNRISKPTENLALMHQKVDEDLLVARANEMKSREALDLEMQKIADVTVREMVFLHFYKGLSWSNVGRRIGMKTSAVKMRWKRFRDKSELQLLEDKPLKETIE